jgi:hypothetical protein
MCAVEIGLGNGILKNVPNRCGMCTDEVSEEGFDGMTEGVPIAFLTGIGVSRRQISTWPSTHEQDRRVSRV